MKISKIVAFVFVLMIFTVPCNITSAGSTRRVDDSYYYTATGIAEIQRHPNYIITSLKRGIIPPDVAVRVEKKLSKAGKFIEVKYLIDAKVNKDFAVFSVRHNDLKIMERALLIFLQITDVKWAEPVYLLNGEFNLYPNHVIALNLKKDLKKEDVDQILSEEKLTVVRENSVTDKPILLWVEPKKNTGSVALANKLAFRKDVNYAEPDFMYKRKLNFIPDDPYYYNLWHYNGMDGDNYTVEEDAHVHIESAWDLAYNIDAGAPDADFPDAGGSIVGVCDEGIFSLHVDLKVAGGFGDFETSDSSTSHGTNVSGVAAAIGNNAHGVAGACPTCSLYGAKLDFSTGVPDSLIFEIYDHAVWFPIGNMAVINNSWGKSGLNSFVPMSQTMKYAIDRFSNDARDGKGGVIVFSSGNDNIDAALDGVMQYRRVFTVGASTCKSERASYSSYGHCVDILAPSNGNGCAITTTTIAGTGYTTDFGGTSSASPVVSGIIGLMVEAVPNITEAQIKEALIISADHINEEEADYKDSPHFEKIPDIKFSFFYSHGRINAFKAVQAALNYTDNCTIEYEVCNEKDDDCDGLTDENDACSPCEIDPETTGKEICADGIDNDCDGFTDPPDCKEPCEDLGGTCAECENNSDCWFGMKCARIDWEAEQSYCLVSCYDDSHCPAGYNCYTSWGFYACIPNDNICTNKEPPYPDESCIPDIPDAGEDAGSSDAGKDAGDAEDAGTDAGDAEDAGTDSKEEIKVIGGGCSCRTVSDSSGFTFGLFDKLF